MMTPIEIETPRLVLRQWRERDREPFAAMNADPAVMEFFPSLQTREASDASIDAWQAQFARQGWSNWAAELRETGAFIGFVGLSVPRRVLPFSPCVEIGWRLARAHWGRGYATEGARAALRMGFEQLGLGEIVSFTTLGNLRSRAVMERIGMRNANEDFEHPAVPEGHALRWHCLYRIGREQWRAGVPVALVDYDPSRIDELVALWRESFEAGVGITDPHPLAEQKAYFLEKVLPHHAVRLALSGGELVGFVSASRESVAQLYVRHGLGGRGIGTRMLDWAKGQSGGSLWLHTFARNERACRFYERSGFVAVERGFEPFWQLEDVRYQWVSAGPAPSPVAGGRGARGRAG